MVVSNDSITYNCEETYTPGILYKTIAAKEFCYSNLTFDYIVRTNLSSFIHIPKLLNYIENQNMSDFMCSNVEYFPIITNENEIDNEDKNIMDVIDKKKDEWINNTKILEEFFGYETFLIRNIRFTYLAGSFYVMSKDIIRKLLYESQVNNITDRANLKDAPDDVAISAIVQLDNIKPKMFKNTTNCSYKCKELIHPSNIECHKFHIRNRTDELYENRNVDIMNMVEQVRFFYDMPEFLE